MKEMTNGFERDDMWEIRAESPTAGNDTFNMSLEEYLLRKLGPKHLALTTVIPLTVIYVFIFVTGIFGNISVCVVIVKNTSLHKATNYYLFSLAASDLMLLILGLPNDLSLYWQQYPWALGEGLCKVRAFVSEMVSYTSVLTIVAFSMERYLAICHPLHHYAMSGLKRAIKIICILWIVSILGAAPFAVYTTVNYLDFPPGSGQSAPESGFCAMLATNIPPNWPVYEISSLLFFLLPMVVILILYIRMGVRIRKRESGNSLRKMEGSVHETKHSNSRKAIIRMLAAVVIAFFLCWAPFHAQRLLYLYANHFPNFPEINEWIYHITGIFYYISSTVNPILYNVMSAKYRVAFEKTLCGCMARRKKSKLQGRSFSTKNCADHLFTCGPKSNNSCSSSKCSKKVDRTVNCSNKFGQTVNKIKNDRENDVLLRKSKNNDFHKTDCNVVVIISPCLTKYKS